jgi:AAA-like domain/Bacterial regulatory proteins, luxR family
MNYEIFDKIYEELTKQQKKILRFFLGGKKDREIASELYCTEANVRQHMANVSKLFNLTDGHGGSSRPELIDLFVEFKPELVSQELSQQYSLVKEEAEFPGAPLSLNSAFYIEPKSVLQNCTKQIKKPGALIRIKSPRKTGKTSLIYRIIDNAKKDSFLTVHLNMRDADKSILSSLDRFLRWFCVNVDKALGLESLLDECWDTRSGSMPSCTTYFESYILGRIDSPLVIILDELDCLFPYPDIHDFFALLRKWYEEAKNEEIWEKLRVVISCSTSAYIKLDINHSPFNVGQPISLPELTKNEILSLSKISGLRELTDIQIDQLFELVGGHPFLIQTFLYNLANNDQGFENLNKYAATKSGIYKDYLNDLWVEIQSFSRNSSVKFELLISSLRKLIENNRGIDLQQEIGFKLEGMGIIRFEGNEVKIVCNLYHEYLQQRLKS